MHDRRTLLLGLGGLGIAALTGRTGAAPDADGALANALAALESSSGGKLGVAVLDCRNGALAGHRLNERFTHCSTFKLGLAAAILARIDSGQLAPDAVLLITRDDAIGHSPAVQAALARNEDHMRVLALAEAAQTLSDNGAANILLRAIGGPETLTRFWRKLGDTVSRLDRYEPALNTSHDGDPRDTTSPAAMAKSVRAILTGRVLKPASRDLLISWMVATDTGLKRLRGGLPAGWRAGDKTGSMWGDSAIADKYNDIAIVWRPGRAAPFIVTAYFESAMKGSEEMRPQDEAVLAQAGRIAAHWMESRA